MSSSMAWWVQLSKNKILEPSFNFSIAFAPSINSLKLPFKRAKRIEKDVKGIDSGTISETFLNAWESVTTSEGGFFKLSKASWSSDSLTTIEIQFESSKSLKVWTCGSIILPLGASLSIGITRITVDFVSTKSPTILGEFINSSGKSFINFALN